MRSDVADTGAAGVADATGATIPVLLNPGARTADRAREAVLADRRFVLREVEPQAIVDTARAAVAEGATRIVVSGGDGTVASVAAVLAGTGVELALLPGGTLNHFAAHLAIPDDPARALDVAATGRPINVDVGFVGERLFVNTSAVGAYVVFVRLRERLERWLGYWLASLVAGVRVLLSLPSYAVELEVEGTVQHYHTPLVFVGVGERELADPSLATYHEGGRRGLHVLVVRDRRAARLFALAVAAARRGPGGVSSLPAVDSFVVDRCTVAVHRQRRVHVATDGEVTHLAAPLEYRAGRDALRVVVPQGNAGERDDLPAPPVRPPPAARS